MTIGRLVIINDFSVKRGGATGLAVLCAQLMRDAGIRVTYISGDTGEGATLARDGIEHVPLGSIPFAQQPVVLGAVRGVWNPNTQRAVGEWIARNDDAGTVYHLHGWHSILSPAIFSALKPVYNRTIVHAHDFFLVCPNGAFMHFPGNRVCGLAPLTAACVASNCDRRRYSHKVLRVLRQVVQNRTISSPDSVLDVMLIHPRMGSFFERSGWPADHLFPLPNPCVPFSQKPVRAIENRRFFFVGRLDEEKGANDFAAAARSAGISAVIIGDGPERAALEREYPEVEFTGWRNAAEIGQLIQQARCLVMPSRYPEPFGLVAVEALSSGIPVIASGHCFIAHDIQELGLGLLVDTRDHAAFAAAMRRIADDASLVEAMSARALRDVGKLCSTVPQWRDALRAHYERLIARDASS